MSYYQDLGVSPQASGEQIRESYHSLVRIFHPDQQSDPALKEAAEAQMRRINDIYAVLSDPERRRQYNAELAGATERVAPIVIHAPRPVPERLRVHWGTVTWGSAVIASAALILWLSNNETPVNPAIDGALAGRFPSSSQPEIRAAQAPVAATDPGTRAVIVDLRRQLRLATEQRDQAWKLLTQSQQESANRHPESVQTKPIEPHMRVAQPEAPAMRGPSPETAVLEMPPAPPGMIGAPFAPPPAIAAPARNHLAGMWFWMKPQVRNRDKTLYPPEFIETTIVERNGSLHGKYRARYQVADRAISPIVNFEFDGKATGASAQLAFQGDGGATGEVTIKLISDNSIELKWSATDLGRSLGLSTGTAVLVRRID